MASLTISLIALVLSLSAVLIAVGSTQRLQRMSDLALPRAATMLSPGLEINDPVPTDALGHLVKDVDRWAAGPSVVIFATSTCTPCRSLFEELGRLSLGRRDVYVIHQAEDDMASVRAQLHGITWIVDVEKGASTAFRIGAFPVGFLLVDHKVADRIVGDDRLGLRRLLDVAPEEWAVTTRRATAAP